MVALMKLLPRIHKSRNVCLEGDEPQQNECQHHQVGQHQGQGFNEQNGYYVRLALFVSSHEKTQRVKAPLFTM
ncbi:EF-hand calcium binding domain 6 [Phyllostomus discolor]|uniref:EF-hand calcium binding domain 6 n=1 Tax=Phyllostomus discolor TaxID=89673 RepID=A0A834ATN0_9CHIR|nr:EF-hand calcium binding domain 6 [Phyllostomus discolor]